MAVRLLSAMKRSGRTLAELVEKLPGFATASRVIPCQGNPGKVLRRLEQTGRERVGEGARVRTKNGVVFVRPAKLGRSLVLTAEAADMETADELCGELQQKLDMLLLDKGGEKK